MLRAQGSRPLLLHQISRTLKQQFYENKQKYFSGGVNARPF
jgi:hypothetical protein